MNYSSWYAQSYHLLTGGGVWLRGGEHNARCGTSFEAAKLRLMFARPATYFDCAESFTHQILFQEARRVEDVFVDLAFLPPGRDLAVFEASEVPLWLGTQSKNAGTDFDLLAISNAILLELLSLPRLLLGSGIPLSKAERLARPELPLVILGGANALYSQVWWLNDPLVDGVFVGESLAGVRKLIEIVRDAKAAGLDKRATLDQLAALEGFFEPERLAAKAGPQPRVRKNSSTDLNTEAALTAGPVSHLADLAGEAQLQLSEGCPCFCTFCAEGWDRKPYRERSPEQLLAAALAAKREMGVSVANLFSFNFNQYTQLEDLLFKLLPHFKRIGLKSQRFDLLAQEPRLVELLLALEKSNFTCGLEGISARLRRFLNKNLSAADLKTSLELLLRAPARELKVFLIATGLEEEEDLLEFGAFLASIKELQAKTRGATRIVFSITQLVCFHHTPLEFHPGSDPQAALEICRRIEASCHQFGFECRVALDKNEHLLSQALARARNSSFALALREALIAESFIYYQGISAELVHALDKRLIEQSVSWEELLAAPGDCGLGEDVPWRQIAAGVRQEFLEEVYRATSALNEVQHCFGASGQAALCSGCGACPSADHTAWLTGQKQKARFDAARAREIISKRRRSTAVVPVLVEISAAYRGISRESLGSAVASALMQADSDLIAGFLGFVGSSFSSLGGNPWVFGVDSFRFEFSSHAGELIQELADESFRASVNERLRQFGAVLGPGSPEWQPSAFSIESPLRFNPERYLLGRGVKFTLRKPEPGRMLYELPKESVKKKVLSALSASQSGERFFVELTVGAKFNLHEFLREAFVCDQQSWVLSTARALR